MSMEMEKSYGESRLPRLRQASPKGVGGQNASDCQDDSIIGTFIPKPPQHSRQQSASLA